MITLLLAALFILTLVTWIVSLTAGATIIGTKTQKDRREAWPITLFSLTMQIIILFMAFATGRGF